MKTLHYFCKLFVSPEVVQTEKLALHKRTPMQPHSKVNPQIFIGFLSSTKDSTRSRGCTSEVERVLPLDIHSKLIFNNFSEKYLHRQGP